MYKIQPEDNIVLVTDGINYDNFAATAIALTQLGNLRAICSTHGWSSVGYSIEGINNLLVAALKYSKVKFYTGSVTSLPDQKYGTFGLFNNIIDQVENNLIDNMYGGRAYLTNIISLYREYISDDITIGDMSQTDGDKNDFYNYAKTLDNLVVISLGPMTDVVPLQSYYKALIQQGGRKYNPVTPIELPKVNPTASSNLYLDPIAARSNLVNSSERIWWVMSETLIDVYTTDQTAALLRNLKTNNPLYNVFLRVMAIYYQGMADIDLVLPLSDVTAIMLVLYPELATRVETIAVDISDQFTVQYTETKDCIISTVVYDKTIASMIPGPYITNTVTAVESQLMAKLFYRVMAPEFPQIEYRSKVQDCIDLLSLS